MAYLGKTHLTFIFKADAADVAEGDRLFKSHNEWMQKTHHRDGEKALLHLSRFEGRRPHRGTEPGSAPSGKTIYVLDEIYEGPAGIADHWQQAMTGWSDFQAFVAWAQKCEPTFDVDAIDVGIHLEDARDVAKLALGVAAQLRPFQARHAQGANLRFGLRGLPALPTEAIAT